MNTLARDRIESIFFENEWKAIASLPHLITDLDGEVIDIIERANSCVVGLWNYPRILVESAEIILGPLTANMDHEELPLSMWEMTEFRSELRSIILKSSMSLYGRDVAFVDTRSSASQLSQIRKGSHEECAFVDNFWAKIADIIHVIKWIILPALPDKDIIVYCSSQDRYDKVRLVSRLQQERGKSVWKLPSLE